MPRSIQVRLVGGLGNQLFGYYAGAALAAHHHTSLILDTSWTRHGITDHGIEILRFDLPGRWLRQKRMSVTLSAPGRFPGRVMAKLFYEFPSLRKALRIHDAPSVGHDPTLLEQPPGTRLRGYFQSWEIVNSAVQHGFPRRPRLKCQSAWLLEMIKRAEAEQPLAVHVRRGDYAKVKEFGLLGPSYYHEAIRLIRERGVDGPLWLFSDEPHLARAAIGRYAREAELIASPDGPSSEMILMSHAAGNVIANSTFSWWGAWMGSPGRPVVAPTPWFVRGPKIEGLIPPEWLLTSAW